MSRLRRPIVSALAMVALLTAVLLPPTSAMAGGWLVLTLDNLPGAQNADEAATLGFVIRQHGIHPIDGVAATATFIERGSGRQLTAVAEPAGRLGHYVVRVMLPAAGMWDWSIDAWNARHPMPALTVVGVTTPAPGVFAPVRWRFVAGGTMLALMSLLGLVVAWRLPSITRRLSVRGHRRLASTERQHT